MDAVGGAITAAATPSGRSWDRPIPPASGPIRFARYAYGPNRLGYCGPEEAAELFEHSATQAGRAGQRLGGPDGASTEAEPIRRNPDERRRTRQDDRLRSSQEERLRGLERQFEGAFPYLELIARANGIGDPLDETVVEAYWLGSPLAAAVRPAELGRSLEVRFRPRVRRRTWRWLAATPEAGSAPVHAFHVLDVFPKAGLLRTGETDRVVEVIDACRIRWGRVLEVDGDWLVVAVVPLELVEGRLALGTARPERIRGWLDGTGFVEDVQPGDVVSIHWDWACERLDRRRLAALRWWTGRELEIANRTI